MIAPCYPESVANEVLSTVGGVRFIKWAQDPLVSFVKCEPPSILLCSGDKRYNAFKDILAPIGFFRRHQPGMAPQAEGYVGGPNQPAFEKPDHGASASCRHLVATRWLRRRLAAPARNRRGLRAKGVASSSQ